MTEHTEYWEAYEAFYNDPRARDEAINKAAHESARAVAGGGHPPLDNLQLAYDLFRLSRERLDAAKAEHRAANDALQAAFTEANRKE